MRATSRRWSEIKCQKETVLSFSFQDRLTASSSATSVLRASSRTRASGTGPEFRMSATDEAILKELERGENCDREEALKSDASHTPLSSVSLLSQKEELSSLSFLAATVVVCVILVC